MEHGSRYRFAARSVSGRRVLDVACGTGFGAAILLSGGAKSVVGVDLDWDALRQAQSFRSPKYSLCMADAIRLPFVNAAFEVVVSFETLEHIENDEIFVAELRRVLGDRGLLILSTPNALVTRPVDGKPRNPYHIHEYSPDELRALLRRHFTNVELRGQRTDPSYGPCPYWERPESVPQDAGSRTRTALWKALRRLPGGVGERASRLMLGRALYPGETDFSFLPESVEKGHVQVALCSP
jgi:SAM-dependent methyltransferase